jgi:antirestriction protein ArdC
VFILNATRFASPSWLSFRQVQSIGATVRKGEHACPVVFWKLRDVERTGKDEEPRKEKRVPLLRYYSVFNIEQCENVKPSLLPKLDAGEFQPIEQCDLLVAQMPKRPKITHGGTRAAYSPIQDTITMPNTVSFDSPEFYYSTLFHELTHATGHGSRLGRKEITEPSGFGSGPYTREELVAEMGAAFLCGHCGIQNRTLAESASYIQGWLDRLRNDRKLVVHAAAQAQKACDFIRGEEYPEAVAKSPTEDMPEVQEPPRDDGAELREHSPAYGECKAVVRLGRLLTTPAALEKIPNHEILAAITRHQSGDWGEVDKDDWNENERALNDGTRLFSVYRSIAGVKFWIITEADRSATMVLLPGDY